MWRRMTEAGREGRAPAAIKLGNRSVSSLLGHADRRARRSLIEGPVLWVLRSLGALGASPSFRARTLRVPMETMGNVIRR